MTEELRICAENNLPCNGVDLFIMGRVNQEENTAEVGEITMRETPTHRAQPAIRLTYAQAHALLEDLWRAGIRPSQIGTAGHVQAMQNHIDDLRMVVKATLPAKETA